MAPSLASWEGLGGEPSWNLCLLWPAFLAAVWQCKRRAWGHRGHHRRRPQPILKTGRREGCVSVGQARAGSCSPRGVGAILGPRRLSSLYCTRHKVGSIPTSSSNAPLSRPRGRRGRRLRPLESTEEYKRRLDAVCRGDMMQRVSGVTMVRRVGDLELCQHGASEFAVPIQGRSGTQTPRAFMGSGSGRTTPAPRSLHS